MRPTIKREGRRFTLRFDPDQVPTAALISRIASRYPVRDLFVEEPPIEQIIAQLYAKVGGIAAAARAAADGGAGMRAYGAILQRRFRMLLQYRAAALAGLGTQVFWGFIRVMIFAAFYAAAATAQPLSFAQVVTYIWLGQAMLRMLPTWNDGELQGMIRSGNVAYELVRPVDLYNLWYARAVALADGADAAAVRAACWRWRCCCSGCSWPAFGRRRGVGWLLCTLRCGAAVAAAIVTLLNITLLWTLTGDGVRVLADLAAWLLSGHRDPAAAVPGWVQTVLVAPALPVRPGCAVPAVHGRHPRRPGARDVRAAARAGRPALVLLGPLGPVRAAACRAGRVRLKVQVKQNRLTSYERDEATDMWNGLLSLRYLGISVRGQMQYRGVVPDAGGRRLPDDGHGVRVHLVLFARFGSLQDWRLEEVALIYGMVHVAFALAEAFARGFDVFDRLVKSGDFDRVLLRPRSAAAAGGGAGVAR